ncbi:cytochrome P450 94A2-like [Amaranthus tricolor]|uniref:cytochrome P450 94A2-like n=1 Tax=Amaranthus tricolor TaxID=29722 RepID=UPI00258282D9|nr:cytochrome P450 94A2-like [Amaranthus tricolor]XP_057517730.1 cytochrome P450 94A2-like [Amaranthus tricolor]XP_057517731.1 cytochrome P450 94A2-like [Amaranthus tricolor]XP_057517732.1 cytochrome P450 94A2-like [Amaranthus tricolor]
MFDLFQFLHSSLLILVSILLLYFVKIFIFQTAPTKDNNQPKAYPLIGHFIAVYQQKDNVFQWLTKLLISSPSSTFILHRPLGVKSILTADPIIVEHILKTRFSIYQKGPFQKGVLRDLLGDGIFNSDGETWKVQRQIASYEFNTKSLRTFVQDVVEFELENRLIPILFKAAKNGTVLDLQDILKRFAFDNICKIAFGYDPQYLSPSLPEAMFAVAFEDAVMISSRRYQSFFPILWKISRFLNIGSEKRLRKCIVEIRKFANNLVKQRKQERMMNTVLFETNDLLSRFLKSGHLDEKFVSDIVISFILAGRDTTSAALTWFFWLLHKNKSVEEEILKEIDSKGKQKKITENFSVFEETKEMVYIHAALCETMRLYPPVAADLKEAMDDDILPGGIYVKKGTRITYHPYAMGRLEKIWGPHWLEFQPERWLEVEHRSLNKDPEVVQDGSKVERWKFVPRDPYSYPVFQAGPRICLGKEMAFLQMKRVVAAVLERFRVVPMVEDGFEPVYVPLLTAKMQGGLPVRIEERIPI